MYKNKTDDKMDELDHQGQEVKDKQSTSALHTSAGMRRMLMIIVKRSSQFKLTNYNKYSKDATSFASMQK